MIVVKDESGADVGVNYDEEIGYAIGFLNDYAPCWYLDIDIDKLNFSSPRDDILGQLANSKLIPEDVQEYLAKVREENPNAGTYSDHWRALRHGGYIPSSVDYEPWAEQHGFEFSTPDNTKLSYMEMRDSFTEQWRAAIHLLQEGP